MAAILSEAARTASAEAGAASGCVSGCAWVPCAALSVLPDVPAGSAARTLCVCCAAAPDDVPVWLFPAFLSDRTRRNMTTRRTIREMTMIPVRIIFFCFSCRSRSRFCRAFLRASRSFAALSSPADWSADCFARRTDAWSPPDSCPAGFFVLRRRCALAAKCLII